MGTQNVLSKAEPWRESEPDRPAEGQESRAHSDGSRREHWSMQETNIILEQRGHMAVNVVGKIVRGLVMKALVSHCTGWKLSCSKERGSRVAFNGVGREKRLKSFLDLEPSRSHQCRRRQLGEQSVRTDGDAGLRDAELGQRL